MLPLSLLRNRVFAVAGALSLIVGFAMFGSVTFLPLYFQTVDAATPTEAGLRLVPMMAGLLVMSIVSGQMISRTGRYRVFPIVGTALMAVGLLLLSRLDVGTSTVASALYLLVLGLGLGSVMQVLVLAVQNAVDYRVLGAATSGVTLFRGIGGSVGAAVFGAIFTSRLTSELHGVLPGALAHQVSAGGRLSSAQLAQLPASTRSAYEHAYVHALSPVFLAAAGVAAARIRAQLAAAGAPTARNRRDQHRPRRQPGRAAIARLPRRDRAGAQPRARRSSSVSGSASDWRRAPASISARGQPGRSCASTSTGSPAPARSPRATGYPPNGSRPSSMNCAGVASSPARMAVPP